MLYPSRSSGTSLTQRDRDGGSGPEVWQAAEPLSRFESFPVTGKLPLAVPRPDPMIRLRGAGLESILPVTQPGLGLAP